MVVTFKNRVVSNKEPCQSTNQQRNRCDFHILSHKKHNYCKQREKEQDLTKSYMYDEPSYQQTIQQPIDNTNKSPKTSITQRLRTDLGRSVGVKTAQLVWFNRLTGTQHSH